MTAPFAEYELTSLPWPDLRTSMALGSRHVLDPARGTYVSRRPSDEIWVEGSARLFELGWGGTQNHALWCRDGVWQLNDLGHANAVRVNGNRLTPRERAEPHALKSHQRIEPATGLVFTFFQRDDLEPIAAQLADHPDALDQISRRGWGSEDERVLVDWILERGRLSRDDALRAIQHFRYRLAQTGTL
ncbi:MAG: hypothetical protein JNM17_41140 [Archangium sp.]|nr:hypothetical protein [Archangium sp.]